MEIKEKISLIFGIPGDPFLETFRAKKAFVAELRPGLEGGRIVARALLKKGVTPIIICDNMMAFCMKRGLVKDVHIFYHALGEKMSLCRTGSLIAALCAKRHKIPAYLHRANNLPWKAETLLKIAGVKVTSQDIPTYVPLLEEVPLDLVRSD
jgi:methylthioribose-1-phosphate isomerase